MTDAPQVADAASRRRRWWPIPLALVGLALVAALVLSRFHDDVVRGRRALTRDNLGNLVKAMLARSTDRMQGYPPYTGRAFILSLVADGYPMDGSSYDVFFSPYDPARLQRPSDAEYRALTRARLAAGGDFRRFTSYVGPASSLARREGETGRGRPMVADLHSHSHGVMVGFWHGAVEFFDRKALGLGPDDPFVVGPESKSPILRQLAE